MVGEPFGETFLKIEHATDELLLEDGLSNLQIFSSFVIRQRRQWPTDQARDWPPQRDFVRKWPDE